MYLKPLTCYEQEGLGHKAFHIVGWIKSTVLLDTTGRYTSSQNHKLRPFKLIKFTEQQYMQTEIECAVAKECYMIQSYSC